MLGKLALHMELQARVFVYSKVCQGSHWHRQSVTASLHQAQRRLEAPWEVQQNVYVSALK